MTKNINAGVIGSNISYKTLTGLSNNRFENISWRKIYSTTSISHFANHHLPGAEIVNEVHEIINDPSINLVFVASSHLEFVNPVIESGKSVRLLD